MSLPTFLSLGGCEIVNATRMADIAGQCRILCGGFELEIAQDGCEWDRLDGCSPVPRRWTTPRGFPTADVPNPTPAPWYRAGEYPSTEFLGFALIEFDDNGQGLSRKPSLRASGGYGAGQAIQAGRELTFRLVGLATSEAGLRWGLRWLADVLASIESCRPPDAMIRFNCAGYIDPAGDPNFPFPNPTGLAETWSMHGVTVLDGIKEQRRGQWATCCSVEVTFSLLVESPWMTRCPSPVDPPCYPVGTHLQPVGASSNCFSDQFCMVHALCCRMVPINVGREAAIVTIRTGDSPAAGPIFVHGYRAVQTLAGGSLVYECPASGSAEPVASMVIMGPIPAKSEMVIDSATESVSIRTLGTTQWSDAAALLTVDEGSGSAWMQVDGCVPLCVCVEVRGSCLADRITVGITAVHQELYA